MIELGFNFIISQIIFFIAMLIEFASMQFKDRKKIFICLIISTALIGTHFIFLAKITAAIILFISTIRFITYYFTSERKFLYLFLLLNTLILSITYTEIYDIIIYIAISLFIIGYYQKDVKLMRKQVMIASVILIIYYLIVFSPIGAISETIFLISNMIGYYRFYIRKA